MHNETLEQLKDRLVFIEAELQRNADDKQTPIATLTQERHLLNHAWGNTIKAIDAKENEMKELQANTTATNALSKKRYDAFR